MNQRTWRGWEELLNGGEVSWNSQFWIDVFSPRNKLSFKCGFQVKVHIFSVAYSAFNQHQLVQQLQLFLKGMIVQSYPASVMSMCSTWGNLWRLEAFICFKIWHQHCMSLWGIDATGCSNCKRATLAGWLAGWLTVCIQAQFSSLVNTFKALESCTQGSRRTISSISLFASQGTSYVYFRWQKWSSWSSCLSGAKSASFQVQGKSILSVQFYV